MRTIPELAIDVPLALALVWLAWRALTEPLLSTAVVLFIAWGLLMSLAWVRLEAPDIALAEAAIGAGLTGALLLDAVRQFHRPSVSARRPRAPRLPGLLAIALGGALALAVVKLPSEPGGLTGMVAAQLERSGVDHPVTAVLLNFRAYDTWLEVMVLVLAALGALTLQRSVDLAHIPPASPPALVADPMLRWLLRLLVPVMVLTGGYLLWLGTGAPGGAFQAGAVIAAAGVVLWMGGYRAASALRGWLLRATLLAGSLAFLTVGAVSIVTHGVLLAFPERWASQLILVVETAVSVSIVVTLAALFVGAHPTPSPVAETRESAAEP